MFCVLSKRSQGHKVVNQQTPALIIANLKELETCKQINRVQNEIVVTLFGLIILLFGFYYYYVIKSALSEENITEVFLMRPVQ